MHKASAESKSKTNCQVLFIGAGFSGALAALEYAKRKNAKDILLLDINESPIGQLSSSRNECYKLHIGHHYVGDIETAEECLLDSIHFVRNFPDAILGELKDPWRRGVNFILSDSLYSVEEVKTVCQRLKELYKEKVAEDIRNKVFGEPEEFIKFVPLSNFPEVSSDIKVDLVLETAESQLDISKFKSQIQRRLEENEKIKFVPKTRVDRITYDINSLNYIVEATDLSSGNKITFISETIVNASWHNIEYLDKQIGLYHGSNRLTRLKASIHVTLPPELVRMNTCIFSVGPYCSFTNLGDGTAIITYEPVTNVGKYISGNEITSKRLKAIANSELCCEDGLGKELVDGIIVGCSKFIPMISKCVPIDVRIGFVKIMLNEGERYTLDRRDSPIHRRQEDGIEVKELCYFSLSGMKATRTSRNANRLADLMEVNLAIKALIASMITKIKDYLESNLSFLIVTKEDKLKMKVLLNFHIKRYLLDEVSKFSFSYSAIPAFSEDDVMKLASKIKEAILVKTKGDKNINNFGSSKYFMSLRIWSEEETSLEVDTEEIKESIEKFEDDKKTKKQHLSL